MNPFDYRVAADIDDALAAAAPGGENASAALLASRDRPAGSVKFIAGGTNLIDLMKER